MTMTIADIDAQTDETEIVDSDVIEDRDNYVFDALKAGLIEEHSPTEATFSVTQAAEACLVSRKTIVRRIPQLEEYGAWKDAQGQWVIPLSALLAADLRPGRPSRPEQEAPKAVDGKPAAPVQPVPAPDDALRTELADWQRRANEAEKRAAVAEAIASERAGRVEDLRMALRQLEPVRTVPANQVVDEQQAKRGWRRFF